MNAFATITRKRPLPVFFTLAFAIATPAFITLTPATPIAIQLPLLILGSYAPAIAALAVLATTRDADEALAVQKRLRLWRVDSRWYLAAVLIPTGIWLGAAAVITLLGASASFQTTGFFFLPIIFMTNLGEEIGWRGYALPRLMTRFRPLTASLSLGLVWGAFHIPLYWQRPLFASLIFALTLAVSVFLTWFFIHTGGSVWLCTLFHAVFNTWSQVLLTAERAESMFATTVVLLWVVVAILVLRYGTSLSRPPVARVQNTGAG